MSHLTKSGLEFILQQLADGKITESQAARALAKPNKARGVPKRVLQANARLRDELAARNAQTGRNTPYVAPAASRPIAASPVSPIVADRQLVAAWKAGRVTKAQAWECNVGVLGTP